VSERAAARKNGSGGGLGGWAAFINPIFKHSESVAVDLLNPVAVFRMTTVAPEMTAWF